MTQKTFTQIESRKVESWLRTLQHCRNNLFLKDWVEHIDDSMTAIKEALAQPAQSVAGYCKKIEDLLVEIDVLKAALAQPAQERNFCERCGKRTADLTVIHTCTPPQEKNNG